MSLVAVSPTTNSVSQLIGTGSTPSLALGSAAGTSASSSIIGTNLVGKITFTSGLSLLSSGLVMTLTFSNGVTYPNGAGILFTPGNAAFCGIITSLYATTTTTSVSLYVAASVLSISTTYIGHYFIVGY